MLALGRKVGDPGVEHADGALEAVDLVEVVADHERVVGGEVAVQGLDEGWDLRAGLADGEAGQLPGVFPGDESLQDRPAAHARDIVSTEVSFMPVSSSSFSSR